MDAREKQRYFKALIGEKMNKEGFVFRNNIYTKIVPSQMMINVFLQTYHHGLDVRYTFVPLAVEKIDFRSRAIAEAEDVSFTMRKLLGDETYQKNYRNISSEQEKIELDVQYLNTILEKAIFETTTASDFLKYCYDYRYKLGIKQPTYGWKELIAGAHLMNHDYDKARELLMMMEENMDLRLLQGNSNLKEALGAKRKVKNFQEFIIELQKQLEEFQATRDFQRKLIEEIDTKNYERVNSIVSRMIRAWDMDLMTRFPKFYI